MKLAFNPSTVAALTTPPNNKDITFDLRGRNIFARGVKFYGTDTNTWRDIKINNVSIDSHTLDLRNGSNTTLTNTNGVVTINSTWRPVVDNLTSDSTTSSLSAKQGKVLKALIDGKSNSDHNHDDRYLKLTGGTMAGNALITFADSGSWWDPNQGPQGARGGLYWTGQSDYAKLYAEETAEDNLDLVIQFGDDNSSYLSIRNKDNIQTSYIASSGVISTGTFVGNLNWSYITDKPATATRWPSWAEVTGKPSSLKNPYALTISLNGTSQGPYDGSAAKNINITPGSIGAAVSNHNHDYLVADLADDKSFNSAYHNFQVLYAWGNNEITGKPANVDAFGLLKFRVAGGWSGQMLLANGGSLYIRSSEDEKMTNTLAWKTILDSSNYSSIIDSRYFTVSEVNILLNTKLNRQNLSYGNWNPRGYHLAADYHYNGGDLSISESGSQIHVSVDGYFWQNEGQYRVLDTSDVAGLKSNLTVYQYLSATDTAWYPLIWGGDSHNNTSSSTGTVFKSHDKLSWQTSSQTLYATNILANNIKSSSIESSSNDMTIKTYNTLLLDCGTLLLNSRGNVGTGTTAPTYQIKFPLASGTVALTSDIPNPTSYYWANVKTSTSSSTTTSPTVHTLTATRVCAGHNPGIDNSISCSNWFRSSGNTGWYNTTYQGGWYMLDTSWIRAYNGVGIYTSGQIQSTSSIRMGNIMLEHTDEINNSADGNIHLNYRNSGNVSLCYGGGTVGIGTPIPSSSYKLDVDGQMKASGFHHASANSDNYMLLAGGGYKYLGGNNSTPIFLGYFNIVHGSDGTVSDYFYCQGDLVQFTYTRGGNYCKIVIPDTTRLSFYIKAAIASVNYSGGGMDTWTGHQRGTGAWWLHCYAAGLNEVRVKGFCPANDHNDSWWGGNPLGQNMDTANRITVCIFGWVQYR